MQALRMFNMRSFACRSDRGRKTDIWYALLVNTPYANDSDMVDMDLLTQDQKTIGAWNIVQIEDGLEGFTLRLFIQHLGWTAEEVHVLLANVRKDLRDPRIHAQFDM